MLYTLMCGLMLAPCTTIELANGVQLKVGPEGCTPAPMSAVTAKKRLYLAQRSDDKHSDGQRENRRSQAASAAAMANPGIDSKGADSKNKAKRVIGNGPGKPEATATRSSRQMLPGSRGENPTAAEVLNRARQVWGDEARMMRMLSGLAYTPKEASADGIKVDPQDYSLRDIQAADPEALKKRASREKSYW